MEQGERELASTTVGAFLDGLAASSATPGGGAAAALAGAMGAALISMVCRLTVGRPRYAAVEPAMQQILSLSEAARMSLVELAAEDERVYASVAAAYKLPRADEAQREARSTAIQTALKAAVVPPLAVARACRSLVPLCLQVAAHGNSNVVSDAGVAAELAAAGVRSSILNVRINLSEIKDGDLVVERERDVAEILNELDDEMARVIGIVRAKLAPKTSS